MLFAGFHGYFIVNVCGFVAVDRDVVFSGTNLDGEVLVGPLENLVGTS